MASNSEFIAYVCDQISGAGEVTSRKMFGEYAVYCNGKVVALVCDNQLFIKPTDAGRVYAAGVEEAPAYPGGKPWLLIIDRLDDRRWLTELVRITTRELPEPKPKKRKNPKK